MPKIATSQWKRYGVIAGSIVAIATLVWNVVAFAGEKVESIAVATIKNEMPLIVDKKIAEHSVEVTEKIATTLSIIQDQMFSMQTRMIKSDIRMLTKNRTTEELTANERSEFEFLLEEQKSIIAQKRKIKEAR